MKQKNTLAASWAAPEALQDFLWIVTALGMRSHWSEGGAFVGADPSSPTSPLRYHGDTSSYRTENSYCESYFTNHIPFSGNMRQKFKMPYSGGLLGVQCIHLCPIIDVHTEWMRMFLKQNCLWFLSVKTSNISGLQAGQLNSSSLASTYWTTAHWKKAF